MQTKLNAPSPTPVPIPKPPVKPVVTIPVSNTPSKEQELLKIAGLLASEGFIAASIITNEINPSLLTNIQSTSQLNIQAIYQGLKKMFNIKY